MTNTASSPSPSWPRILTMAVAFWVVLGLVSATLTYSQTMPNGPLEWTPLRSLQPVLYLLPFAPATLWLWFESRAGAQHGFAGRRRRSTAILLLLAVAVSIAQMSMTGGPDLVPMIVGFVLYNGVVLLAVLAACTAYHTAILLHQRQSELVAAQLRGLKAQLHPHALFNTLQAIGSTAENDGATAARMVALLGDMLRHNLERRDGTTVALADELAMLDPYLQLQRLRFADRLTIELDIAAEVRRAQVPDLLLQPLVENALLHGIERRPGDGTIQIRAHRDGEHLAIEVADDGVATTAADHSTSTAADTAYGTGLGTTTARLHTLFGERASLQLRPNGRGGTTARVRLPFREIGDAA